MRKQIVVCDVCQSEERDTEGYRIGRETGPVVKVDLCEEHAAPFSSMLSKDLPKEPISRRAGKRAPRVTTLADIEAMKTQKTPPSIPKD